jgi:uncharacterized protein YprB with RNaseH-like and TPR domain
MLGELLMKKINIPLEDFTLSYPLDSYAPLDQIFFIDIETTGFTAKGSSLYLIGGAYFKDDIWHIIQWFADYYSEEEAIMRSFKDFASNYSYFIHFNGNNFDIPYLSSKARMLDLDFSFLEQTGLDLYRRITPYKSFLKLPNCKQKTIEEFLNINRKDTYGGGELISMYHDYVSTPSDFSLQTLLLHNSDDMKGMLEILPILSYFDLFNKPIVVEKVQANAYTNYSGEKRKELYMKLAIPSSLPKNISLYIDHCYFSYKDENATLRVPIIETELKYFYSNYEDYYYLPEEDTAIHKAVATYVDSSRRSKAKASNCYTKHSSTFLKQWDLIKEPFFKPEYKSKDLYFELTDDTKKDRDLFHNYATHVLNHMLLESKNTD